MMLDPKSITVGERQRRTQTAQETLDDQFVQSVCRRLIHPIVVRRDPDGEHPVLVAGGRRLAALIQGGVTELYENIHFRFFDDLTSAEAKLIELEENIKRSDLPWRDHVAAIGELYKLYEAEHSDWTQAQIVKEMNFTVSYVLRILMVYKNLNSNIVKDATSFEEAYRRLQTAAERRAAAIVSQITEAGSQIFAGVATRASAGASASPTLVTITAHPPKDSSNGSDTITSDLDLGLDGDDPSMVIQDPGSTINGTSTGERTTESAGGGDQPYIHGHASPTTISSSPILVADFLTWAPVYSGPKFNFIHCDFPFGIGVFQGTGMKPNSLGLEYADDPEEENSGEEIYFKLLDALCNNLDRLASYSSHLMLWFSMNHYERIRKRLLEADLFVLNHPLVWHKSNDVGMIPGRGNHPRRVYETAFLCSRGQRPLTKKVSNACSRPTAQNPIHPSQKPEPVLRYFFEGLVDETTDVLDPTAGSGSALRAAEDVGARSVLGLELSPTLAETANSTTLNARRLRQMSKELSLESVP